MRRLTGPDGDVCNEDGCTRPATHERLLGMIDDDEIVELVCELHDTQLAA